MCFFLGVNRSVDIPYEHLGIRYPEGPYLDVPGHLSGWINDDWISVLFSPPRYPRYKIV